MYVFMYYRNAKGGCDFFEKKIHRIIRDFEKSFIEEFFSKN